MNFFLLCSETSLAGSRIWLAHWSSSNVTDSSEQDRYVGIYSAMGVGQGFFLLLVAITLAYMCVTASTVLHEKLLGNLLRLPLTFFETTPLGRIVNRFSKDIDVIDTMIPRSLSWFFQTFASILGTIFLICYSTPLFMTVLLPLAVLYMVIQVSPGRVVKVFEFYILLVKIEDFLLFHGLSYLFLSYQKLYNDPQAAYCRNLLIRKL